MAETPVSLLDRLRGNPDGTSWSRFVQLYTPLIRDTLRRHGVPLPEADDLVQEVLQVVVREIPQFRHNQQQGAFRAWLRTVTVHRLSNFWRNRRAQPQATGDPNVWKALESLEDPASDLSRSWELEHDRHVARRLLELIEPEFAPETWQAFQRVVVEGARVADVASELGVTANAVYVAKSRVMKRLREEGRGLID